VGAVIPLDPPFACGELAGMMRIPSCAHMRPNCVTGTVSVSRSSSVGFRTYTFFQSVYSACGTPCASIQSRNTATAAQIVSWALNRPVVRLVASSTSVSRQLCGPRPSNHA
jgi:hypothetical protein